MNEDPMFGAPPPIDPQPYATPLPNQDNEHLKLLSVFYYIWAGLDVLAACGAGLYILLAGAILTAAATAPTKDSQGAEVPLGFVGSILGVVGFSAVFFLIGMACLHFFAAKAISERRSSTLVYLSAGVCCLSVPLGTILGVFTFIVMSRPSVKAMFSS